MPGSRRAEGVLVALLLALGAASARAEPTNDPPLTAKLVFPAYQWDITGARLLLTRDGRLIEDSFTSSGAEELLQGVPQAAMLAHQGHQRLLYGNALFYGGVTAVLIGLTGAGIGAAQVTNSSAQWGFGTSGAILTAAGLTSSILGLIAVHTGLAKVLAAVEVYDLELLRGASTSP